MKDVLLIDDDVELMQSLARALSPLIAPRTLIGAGSYERAIEVAVKERPSVVVLDLCLDPRRAVESGFALLRSLKERDESIRVIVLTGHGSAENGVRALDQGAASFIEKPVDPHHLAALIKDGVTQSELKRRYEALRPLVPDPIEVTVVGVSSAAEHLREQIRFASSNHQPVLVLGETGTGKGLIARAIHENSRRRNAKLVHYHPNYGGGDIVQSELFGHLKGAFTGAHESRKGMVVEADGGTLFLDELDQIPHDTQVKLLDLIQEKRVRPVGADTFCSVDCRVIAATNAGINEALERGVIRKDLYHRIAHFVVEIPPLRERLDDIVPIARTVLRELAAREEVNVFEFEPDVVRSLSEHTWPGNVRELRGVVESAALHAQYKGRTWISLEDLRVTRREGSHESVAATLAELVQDYKVRLIKEALAATSGNQLQAARKLGIDRGTLRRLIGKACD